MVHCFFAKVRRTVLIAAMLASALPCPWREARAADVLVFAAASTTAAMRDITAEFSRRNAVRVVPSFAASSTLAKQIRHGAPADVFLSANPQWMDYLAREGAIVAASRVDLLANRLVMVAPLDSRLEVHFTPGIKLAETLRGRLAVGDPAHVPAGIYARAALEHFHLWRELAPLLVRTQDARFAVAVVERGEVAAAIVYASDARMSKKVRTVARFPENAHPPITYPAALVAGRERPLVRSFFEYLTSREAGAIFASHGFTALMEPKQK